VQQREEYEKRRREKEEEMRKMEKDKLEELKRKEEEEVKRIREQMVFKASKIRKYKFVVPESAIEQRALTVPLPPKLQTAERA
jgi:Targeting protein for Xklp2 (TPX2) domain